MDAMDNINNGPNFNTYLEAKVVITPQQMDNNIYKHMKDNLIRDLEKKCYKNFGFISKIYKIEERTGGTIIQEDPNAAAVYMVKFACELWKPLRNTYIICEVMKINKSLIVLQRGPIIVFLFDYQLYGTNKIAYDERSNVWVAKLSDTKGIKVFEGTFIKILVEDINIEHKATQIIVLGSYDSVVTEIDNKENNETFIEYDKIKEPSQLAQSPSSASSSSSPSSSPSSSSSSPSPLTI